MNQYTHCRICKTKLHGRTDKQFCSQKCKSFYHRSLKKATESATAKTDKILHRNRSILLELMGKNSKQKQIAAKLLFDHKNFKRQYMTGFFENAQGKRYYIVYDFAWMEFSTGQVLLIRRAT